MAKLEDVLEAAAELKQIRDAQQSIVDSDRNQSLHPAILHLYERLGLEAEYVLGHLRYLAEYVPASEPQPFERKVK